MGLLMALSPQAEGGWHPPERWCEQLFTSVVPVLLGGPEEEPGGRQVLDLDCFLSDISDTLFTMTQPSPTPLQLPPEDGEGLHQGRETCGKRRAGPVPWSQVCCYSLSDLGQVSLRLRTSVSVSVT